MLPTDGKVSSICTRYTDSDALSQPAVTPALFLGRCGNWSTCSQQSGAIFQHVNLECIVRAGLIGIDVVASSLQTLHAYVWSL